MYKFVSAQLALFRLQLGIGYGQDLIEDRVRVRIVVKVMVKVNVRFRVQKDLVFDPWRHPKPFIWETYRNRATRARNRA